MIILSLSKIRGVIFQIKKTKKSINKRLDKMY